jgi:hypothetical protein
MEKPSFFVTLDHLKKKLVITIRGTQSLKDFLTNIQWKAVLLPDIDPLLEWYGHEVKKFKNNRDLLL